MNESLPEEEPQPPRLRIAKGSPWRIDPGRRAKWSAPAKKPRMHRGDLEALAQRMFASMVAARGIGIAAPQIGVPLRVAIMDVDEAGIVAIEPKIEWVSDELEETTEGCLSV